MFTITVLAILKLLGVVYLSWLEVIGYGILAEFILGFVITLLGD